MRASDLRVARSLPLFADMQQAHFRSLMSAALLQSIPPHVVLIREGELPDFLHVLVEGAVELFASHADRETTIQVIVPPATFIIAPIVLEELPLKSAQTLVKSRVLMIPADAVRRTFGRDAAFARAVVGELALRYRDLVRAIKAQKLRTGAERLANWILQTDASKGSSGRVTLPFEKRLLASLLGMTPANLSRSLAALASHGIVSEGRTIVIKNRKKLQRVAQENPLIEAPRDIAERT